MTVADCKFCQIASGALASSVVFEDSVSLAFLDFRPVFPGHVLLIPKEHFATLDELPAESIGPFFSDVQLVARGVERGMKAEGTFVAINNKISQSVPHLHVHIVPRRKGDGLRGFFWPRQKYKDDAEMKAAADAIRHAIRS
ncbi:MAG TPA: HIT family protein [Bryobacteraceae bacterium]|nr:HIT family protein [Bryobacteraceae bacterium]